MMAKEEQETEMGTAAAVARRHRHVVCDVGDDADSQDMDMSPTADDALAVVRRFVHLAWRIQLPSFSSFYSLLPPHPLYCIRLGMSVFPSERLVVVRPAHRQSKASI